MLRERLSPPPDIFPPETWTAGAKGLDPKLAWEFAGQAETMFALSNGYLGIRGTPEEGRPVREPGVLLNGFYEFRPITYGEFAYGFPRVGQSILNCPDGTIIKLFVDGRCMRLRTSRLVSFERRHLAAILYELIPEEADADIVISSELTYHEPLAHDDSDPRLAAGFVKRVLQPAGNSRQGRRAILSYVTLKSGLILGCGMDHVLETDCNTIEDSSCGDDAAAVVFKIRGERGRPIRLWKYLAYHYSHSGDVAEVRSQVAWTLDRALQDGFDRIRAHQHAAVGRFWKRADVEVEGADRGCSR
jgi:alpha,alpha-trehalose phosphorylase